MRCKDCPHFHIRYEPYKSGGVIWDMGLAECKKTNMVVDFASHKKLDKLECVEKETANEQRESSAGSAENRIELL